MKYKKLILLILIGVLLQHTVSAQNVRRYFLIDSVQQKNLKINHIKCADENYKAELFNVFYVNRPNYFILFTALPDYKSKKPEWKPINLDSISQKMVSIDTLKKEFTEAFKKFFKTQGVEGGYKFKSTFVHPIVKIGNAYYSPSTPVLMEHFLLNMATSSTEYIANVFPNLSQFFEINIDVSILPLTKFENIYLKKFGHPSFNSHYDIYDLFNTHYVYNKPILLRDENTKIDGKTAYKYWTLASWPIDGYNSERGVDRFANIPEYGIVSGAYSFYFWAEYLFGRQAPRLTKERKEQLIQNYLKDVQLMPYEINGKPVAK